jgi:uncharacterized membrane protein (UPF0182 family)
MSLMTIRRIPLFLLLILVITGLPALAELYTDWLWFREVGHEQVFLKSFSASSLVTTVSGLIVFAVLAANALAALRGLRPRPFMIVTPQGPQPIAMDLRSIKRFGLAALALVSVLIAFYAGGRWETWLYFLNGTPFGQRDPILGHDIGFYVFTLPLLEQIHGILYLVVLLMAATAVAAYLFGEELGLDATRGIYLSRRATRHLGTLAALLLIVLALGAWLQIPQLLIGVSGNMAGATYTDVHARIPALRILIGAAVLSAILVVWQAFTSGRLRAVAAAAGIYVLCSIGGSAYAAIIQRFVVAPNEQVRETPFIGNNIRATRAGFGLDTVVERPLSGEAHLTRADLDRNAATIDNVPLWNDRPLLDTFGQLQEIRTYYDFAAVDNDRYMINGQYRQIMLSARELNSQTLPSRTWINEHLTFTHGYGLTLGPVNEVTSEGLPVLFIRDLPPVSSVDLNVTQPAIYFGELQNTHVFVKTLERVPPADVCHQVPLDGHVLLAEPHRTKPRDAVPAHRGAGAAHHAVLRVRPGSVLDHCGRTADLDAGRLHDVEEVSVFDACCLGAGRGRELHPQLGQGDDRRISRDYHLPRRGSLRSDRSDHLEDLSRPAPAARGDAGGTAHAPALPAADLRPAGSGVRDVSHDQSRGVLQPRGSMGDPEPRC